MSNASADGGVLKVAVIGAGVGGLTLAKTLLNEGPGKAGKVQVCVYEAWDEWKVRGGALGLSVGARVLNRLGLGAELEAVCNHGRGFQYYVQGGLLNSLAVPGYFAMRADLQRLLVDSLPSDVIKLGHKLVDIVEEEGEVKLSFQNGAKDSAHLVVASDGIHSFVRQRVFGMDKPVYTGFRVLYSVSSKPIRSDPTVACVNWAESDGAGYGVLDMTAGQGQSRHDIAVVILRSEEQASDRWDSTIAKERLAKLAQRIAPDHPVLGQAVENAEVCFDWGIYQAPARQSWISGKGRVVLLGDAAHATAPFMGQGANMAMHDGWCLGRILLNEKISLPEGLRLYESERKSQSERVVAQSSSVGQMHTATGLKAIVRNHLLGFLLFSKIRSTWAVDPTERNPWDVEPSFLQKMGRTARSMCS